MYFSKGVRFFFLLRWNSIKTEEKLGRAPRAEI